MLECGPVSTSAPPIRRELCSVRGSPTTSRNTTFSRYDVASKLRKKSFQQLCTLKKKEGKNDESADSA